MDVCRECRKVQPIAHLPFCKECLTTLYQKYYNSMSKGKHFALWCMCAELNIPYYNHLAKQPEVRDIISYIKVLFTNEKFNGFSDTKDHLFDIVSLGKMAKQYNEQVDTRLEAEQEAHGEEVASLVSESDFEKKELKEKIENQASEITELKRKLKYAAELLDTSEDDIEESVQRVKDFKNWGDGFTPEEYSMLNEIYDLYTCEIENVTPAMQFRYQDLSKLELRRRQLGSNADPKESKTIADELKALYTMLDIGDFEKATKSDDEKYIDRVIWEIENTSPAELEDLEKYRDFAPFQEACEEIYRCTLNAVAGTQEFPDLKTQEGDD